MMANTSGKVYLTGVARIPPQNFKIVFVFQKCSENLTGLNDTSSSFLGPLKASLLIEPHVHEEVFILWDGTARFLEEENFKVAFAASR